MQTTTELPYYKNKNTFLHHTHIQPFPTSKFKHQINHTHDKFLTSHCCRQSAKQFNDK